MTQSCDTVIIGGGFAGVTAARELSRAGQSVILLEAKDRLGGRAWVSELGGVQIELGGGYVHWSQPHVWSEITRYGLSLVERPYYTSTNAMQRTRFLRNGALQAAFTPEEAAEIKAAFTAYVAPAREVFPQPFQPFTTDKVKDFDHLSARDRIDEMPLSDLARDTLLRTAGMQCNNAADAGGYIEALRWYALANCHDETYAASVSRFTLAEGTKALLDAMVRDSNARIELSTTVERVAQQDCGVTVETSQGAVRAAHCIVATGVNVWKGIEFAPALSPEKAALSREELSGKGGKIYLRLKGRFEDSRWSALGGAILSVLPHVIGEDASVVVAFTNPEHPMEEVTLERLQAEVDRFGAGLEVLDFAFHDWVSDPHALGTWGNFRPNQFTRCFRQALQHEGRLHFASGDIAQGWRGFFDGAIESGLRSARAVLVAED